MYLARWASPCRLAVVGPPAATRAVLLRNHEPGRRKFTRRVPSKVQSSQNPAGEEGTAEQAYEVAEHCVELFQLCQVDQLVQHLPDALVDRCMAMKREKEQSAAPQQQPTDDAPITFSELLDLAQPGDLSVDAYAMRALVLAPPAYARPLSSLRLGPGRFLQRYLARTASGEEMTLTIVLKLEESLEPRYRGLQVVHRWFLHSITGEPAEAGELPAEPSPQWGPESVVAAQLQALRDEDVAAVFRHASPANQEATGERFGQMLRSAAYRPLLGHRRSEVLQSVQIRPERALVIVGVTPCPEAGVVEGMAPSRVVYVWSLSLQGGEHPTPEPCRRCWMTDMVQPVTGSTGLFSS